VSAPSTASIERLFGKIVERMRRNGNAALLADIKKRVDQRHTCGRQYLDKERYQMPVTCADLCAGDNLNTIFWRKLLRFQRTAHSS
jgi:hypothetical protein